MPDAVQYFDIEVPPTNPEFLEDFTAEGWLFYWYRSDRTFPLAGTFVNPTDEFSCQMKIELKQKYSGNYIDVNAKFAISLDQSDPDNLQIVCQSTGNYRP